MQVSMSSLRAAKRVMWLSLRLAKASRYSCIPQTAAVESNNMLISKIRELFLILSSSPQQELEMALDKYIIAQCRYSYFCRVWSSVNINAFIFVIISDLSEKYK